ncbi:MAG: substrate-binding domain-containing protein [Lentisphaeria bacterium]|nr:substrate-binding domain-containing protein [Lentisphaeria bacterium]
MKKTKAEQIYESLRREIDHNPPGTRLGSIRSLMRQYKTSQFSITGAIRKLEEDKLLHRSTRGELLVRPQGEGTRSRIGIWMPDWPALVHLQHEESIRREALRHNLEAVRINYSRTYSFQQLETEGLSAVIVLPLHRLQPNEIYHLGNAPIPVVIIGRLLDGIELNYVSTDPFQNGMLAAGCFFRHGHRKLALALSEPQNAVQERRRDGFLTFSRAVGCSVQIIDCNVHEGENAAVSTNSVFSELLRSSMPKFTALYMMSGVTAFSAISALAECGYRVPDDVSVIAADNLDQAAFFLPPVTCIDADMQEYAGRVVNAVLRLLGEPGLPCLHEIVDQHVIERGSIRTLPPPPQHQKKSVAQPKAGITAGGAEP